MRSAFLLAGLTLMTIGHPAHGHEFIVLPSASTAPSGGTLSADLTMTETWIEPDRAPPPEMVTLELVDESSRVSVPLSPTPNSLRASVITPAGPFVLAATMRRDRIETPRVPKGAPKPEGRMTRSETFSKTYINLTDESSLWSRPLRTRLEIVPLANPSSLKAGDTLEVKILFEGQPVSARVQATFDRKGTQGHGFAVRTESGADGTARIALNQSGRWLIRARHGVDEAREGYVHYAGGANLILEIE
ncbi:MAG: DUF4198 domain-containing protein [Sphingobium limneticum]